MKFLACFLLFLGTVTLFVGTSPLSSHPANKFKDHKIKCNKSYSGSEELLRLALFTLVDHEIEQHNTNPKKTYVQGHNHISDWTPEEKKSLARAKAPTPYSPDSRSITVEQKRAYPTSLNLVNSTKCVGPIKDQGLCGSCYAFSAIANIEYSHCVLHNQTYVNLSEEQVVDCDMVEAANFGSQYGGCNGGAPSYVWRYLSAAGGSQPTSSYGAYTAGTTNAVSTCKFSAKGVKAKVAGSSYVYADTTSMIAALNTQGILSVAVYATSNFQAYHS